MHIRCFSFPLHLVPHPFCRLQRHGLPIHAQEEEVRQVGQRWWRFVSMYRRKINFSRFVIFLSVSILTLISEACNDDFQTKCSFKMNRTGLGRPEAPRQARGASPQGWETGENHLHSFSKIIFRNCFSEAYPWRLLWCFNQSCLISSKYSCTYI